MMRQAIFFVPILASLVASQTILQYGSGALPSCASNCGNLTTAQTLCVPPVAPSSSQTIYDTCWCNSNYFIDNLAGTSTPAALSVCSAVCTSASDQQAIISWYDSFCKSGTPGGTATGTATGAATATTAGAAATSTGATSGTGSTSGTSNGSAQPLTSGQTWWHQHSRWIAMAIVLIFAFIIIAVLGMWLKRRSTRKHQRMAALAPPVVWGPHQNQHYTGGVAYGTPSAAARGKGPQMSGPSAPMLPTTSSQPMDYSVEGDGAKKKGGKLRKLMGRS